METTTFPRFPASFRARRNKAAWPACSAPIVGTKTKGRSALAQYLRADAGELGDFHRPRRETALSGCRTWKSASNLPRKSRPAASLRDLSAKWEFEFKPDSLLRRGRGVAAGSGLAAGNAASGLAAGKAASGLAAGTAVSGLAAGVAAEGAGAVADSRRNRGIHQLLLNAGSSALSP